MTFAAIGSLLTALIPLISQIIGLFVKTPDEQKQAFLDALPGKLREVSDAVATQSAEKDPSAVNRILNGG